MREMKDNLEAERNSVTDVGARPMSWIMTASAKLHRVSDFEAALLAKAGHDVGEPFHVIQSTRELVRLGLRALIWGAGQALLEQSEMDPVLGRFLNRNYTGYLVPTSADIPELETLFVGEFDEEASLLGAEGLGELTAVSVAPAITNAVYHATGKRIRDLPITIEKLL
jgi:hypothetical protein